MSTPVSLTPKQEAFAQAYIETGNASEAYRRAYNASNFNDNALAVQASKMLKHPKVALRIAELKAELQKRHEVTVDTLVAELEEARSLALKIEAPAPAVAATMGKGKLLGLIVDRAEHTGKDGGPIETREISDREFARWMALKLHRGAMVNGHDKPN